MVIKNIIEKASNKELADLLITSFQNIERNYNFKSWKSSELDSGHFVESVRRFLELKLFGQYTPVNKPLSNFNEKTLTSYQNKQGNESYRVLIPRLLFVIYGIRNKRGVGHISKIHPNKIDASLILSSSKWILAELIRLNSDLAFEKTELLIDEIVQRNIEGIWDIGKSKRILIDGLSVKEKIIFLLFNSSKMLDSELIEVIEYKNPAYFKKVLKELHSNRTIEYYSNGDCLLSPKGALYAEKIIIKNSA